MMKIFHILYRLVEDIYPVKSNKMHVVDFCIMCRKITMAAYMYIPPNDHIQFFKSIFDWQKEIFVENYQIGRAHV